MHIYDIVVNYSAQNFESEWGRENQSQLYVPAIHNK